MQLLLQNSVFSFSDALRASAQQLDDWPLGTEADRFTGRLQAPGDTGVFDLGDLTTVIAYQKLAGVRMITAIKRKMRMAMSSTSTRSTVTRSTRMKLTRTSMLLIISSAISRVS